MQTLINNIIELRKKLPCPLVGISGIDGSGKTYLAEQISKDLTSQGLHIALINVDQFHNPPEIRFGKLNPGKHFYESAFDFERIFGQLIDPLRIHRRIDTNLEVTRLPENDFFNRHFFYEDIDVIILEGILLFKNTLKHRFDYKVWVDCSFRTSIQRALSRGQEGLDHEATLRDYEEIYHAAQKQHYSIDEPKASADYILVNDPIIERGPEILLAHPTINGRLHEFLQWFNEPEHWRIENNSVIIQPNAASDFWQRTHYGFQNDNGHFLYLETNKDIIMQTHVRFKAAHQFDQSGLMIRLDQDNWLKTSIEYQLENPASLGAVVTNFGYSDWSIQFVDQQINEAWFRLERSGKDFVIDASLDGKVWHRIRVCRLHKADGIVQCGLYSCSPIDCGYEAIFEQFEINDAIA